MTQYSESYRLKRMAKLVSSCHEVLDVGCAQYPNEYLSNPIVIGADIQQTCLPDNYSGFFHGTLKDMLRQQKRFDAIIAGEILEHLEDPIGFLRQCRQLLIRDGLLILSTPNPHSPIEAVLNLFLCRRFFYSKDHVMLFTQRWLIRMIERAGFHEVELFSGGFPLPPVGLVPFPRPWCYQTIVRARSCNSL